jgi:hypothetical protein
MAEMALQQIESGPLKTFVRLVVLFGPLPHANVGLD